MRENVELLPTLYNDPRREDKQTLEKVVGAQSYIDTDS